MSVFDHFTSIPPWLTTLTNDGGTATIVDSNLQFFGNSDNDAAGAYVNTPIDKTKSQLWVFPVKVAAIARGEQLLWLIGKSSAPVVDTATVWLSTHRIAAINLGTFGGNQQISATKYDSSDVRTEWNRSSSSWVTPGTAAPMMGLLADDDYMLLGFENDGPNGRWRFLAGAHSNGSSYSADHGLSWWEITDWVTWAGGKHASLDTWLVLGHPQNATGAGSLQNTISLEWARFADGPKIDAWTNQKDGSTNYNIKHGWSYDGVLFTPETRAGVAIAPVAATWESTDVKDKSIVIDDDGTYYMAYQGFGSVGQIGMASSPTGLDGSWTKDGDNPVITATGADTDEEYLGSPYLLKDHTDPDPAKRWKCYYQGVNIVSGGRKLFLATASTPLGTWTKQGIMLDQGASGAFDEDGPANPVVIYVDGLWELWYAGQPASPASYKWQVGRATAATANGPFTRDGSGVRIGGQVDEVQNISANLTGRIASMTDTTGFVADQVVCIDQDATSDNYNVSRVRKVTTNTSLELYHRVPGFTTAASAQVRGYRAGAVTIHHIDQAADRTWRFYCTLFAPFDNHATFRAFSETTALFTAADRLGTPAISWIDSPQTGFGQWNNKRASENIAIARGPIGPTGPPSIHTFAALQRAGAW